MVRNIVVLLVVLFFACGCSPKLLPVAKNETESPWKRFDQAKEAFHDHPEANKLARGFCREPYVVPDLSV